MFGLSRKRRRRNARGRRKTVHLRGRRKSTITVFRNPGRRRARVRRLVSYNRRRRYGRKRNPALALYGVANPRRRRGGRRVGRRRTGGFSTRGIMGGVGKLMSADYLVKTLVGGIGFLGGIALPNWLFGGQSWYAGNPWVKVGVRALFGLVALPMVAGFIPGAYAAPLLVGAGIAVGVSALAELTGRSLAVGGPADVALTPGTFFPALAISGMGAYVPRMLPGSRPFGAYLPRITQRTVGGVPAMSGGELAGPNGGMGSIYDK